ncbi:MAG: alpha/beta hydrolase [Planctomycetes bacterium]|nr:alpha/beta hydrolase [Planctomycetota bacterium]
MKLVIAVSTLLLIAGLHVNGEQDARPLAKETHDFKRVGDVAIQADVYRRNGAQSRPVLVWIHGGALIVGSRVSVPGDLLKLCRDENYILVSIDYRLAPEVKLRAIAADLVDAIDWIRTTGPKAFHADPKRIVIAGGSAGGYLTMLAGIKVKPRPLALVAYWGYGDVDGDWYIKPARFYRENFPIIGKDDAFRAVGKKVLTGTDGKDPEQKDRGLFYRYLRQNGLWTKVVTGFDPLTEKSKLDPYCPVRNITAQYPPILMIHGTKDEDVPYELSADMARELARHKVAHELVTVPDAGHGLAGGKRELVDKARRRALAFIRERLRDKE